jgi:hypothetical protein
VWGVGLQQHNISDVAKACALFILIRCVPYLCALCSSPNRSYEDNGDVVNNLTVIVNKSDKSNIEAYGSADAFLEQVSYLLGKQSYEGEQKLAGSWYVGQQWGSQWRGGCRRIDRALLVQPCPDGGMAWWQTRCEQQVVTKHTLPI